MTVKHSVTARSTKGSHRLAITIHGGRFDDLAFVCNFVGAGEHSLRSLVGRTLVIVLRNETMHDSAISALTVIANVTNDKLYARLIDPPRYVDSGGVKGRDAVLDWLTNSAADKLALNIHHFPPPLKLVDLTLYRSGCEVIEFDFSLCRRELKSARHLDESPALAHLINTD